MKPIRFYAIYKNRIMQHILFWVVSYYILLRFFVGSGQIQRIDYIYTALFHINLIIGVYVNLIILIPKLLGKRKFVFYGISLLLVIAGSAELNIVFFDKLVDLVLPGYYFISYYEFTDSLKFVVIYIGITSLIKLSKSWFELLKINKLFAELQKEKTEAELKALKGQINPHFLFNSLNVLYSLAIKKSGESAEVIIQLSDILRYVIYDSNKDDVNLKDEIKLITDYLSIQKYRIDSDSKVDFKVDVRDDDLKIAPMLFLPLVENSFKHGIKGDIVKTYVDIELTADRHEIHFEIKNNKGASENLAVINEGGVGLTNIRNRLKLIYPERHNFDITENDNFFQVKLIIRTKE
jgi:sensor histidine kinase YesM